MSFNCITTTGQVVQIVNKVYEGDQTLLVDEDGNLWLPHTASAETLSGGEVSLYKAADDDDSDLENVAEDAVEAIADAVEGFIDKAEDAIVDFVEEKLPSWGDSPDDDDSSPDAA
jgi:hypothetical protein